MKTQSAIYGSLVAITALFLTGCATAPATLEAKQGLVDRSSAVLKEMEAKDAGLARFLDTSYAYAIFPDVGKGAWIVGGGYGRGVVYEKGTFAGYGDFSQASVGLSFGGQAFSELIVFETREAFARFTSGKLEFAANLSAVALKSGAAESARYTDGVAVFADPIGGLMLEASVGGQQFTYQPR